MQLRHLLSIKDLEAQQIHSIFDRAAHFRQRGFRSTRYQMATALIFAENSTRTRVSFERASQELGKAVVILQPEQSSLEKGESLLDTLENISALQCDLAVIRCTDEKLLRDTAVDSPISIINAGDGAREHPTQALLDLFSLWWGPAERDWKRLKDLKIAIVGDLLRSRVARSWAEIARTLALNVEFISPAAWKPTQWEGPFQWSDQFKSRISSWDAIMALRVQKERFRGTAGAAEDEIKDYVSKYQLTPKDLGSSKQKIMHPGPVNWGIELHEDLKKDPRSMILEQVNCGLFSKSRAHREVLVRKDRSVIVNQKPRPVTLALECGAFFEGQGWGDFSQARGGEFVFCTAMSGIEESLTDPSFCRQILVSTLSHVGNTGYTADDREADKIWAEGLICRTLESEPSNWRAKKSLKDWIVGDGRFVVEGINTRLLTTLLREEGSQRGIVFENGTMTRDEAQKYLREKVPSMDGLDLTTEVSCSKPYRFQMPENDTCWEIVPESYRKTAKTRKIAVWDFGVKKNTLRILTALGMDVEVLPANSKAADFLSPAKAYDGILLSNGPGDPAAASGIIRELKEVLGKKPLFAICLGHQLVANAIGARTFKMKFGHRGIHHPVVEVDASGKPVRTWISSQNHGFAVDAGSLPKGSRVSFFHGDDQSVEGLSLPELNCETVQFHPEAGPGPYDSWILLDRFVNRIRANG